jgi:hypothetical protein
MTEKYPDNSRLVPLKKVTRKDFDELALDKEWMPMSENAGDDFRPYEKIYMHPELEAEIYWVENDILGFNYIIVSGPDHEAVAKEASEIPHHTAESLQVEWDKAEADTEKRIPLLQIAAYAADTAKFDPKIFSFFEWAFENSDPAFRTIALNASVVLDWPQFDKYYQQLKNDPDDIVRHLAETSN